ncbi:tetratricopeptide repeat protein [Zobellella maritima]|uniref:tetratricopeptide repeat protein n=1 Tax=Zobellella maritima TaxID=2059725 RepID=UPI000E304975|nr:tetratricopeptide repeat protein [Zobellella maritima]
MKKTTIALMILLLTGCAASSSQDGDMAGGKTPGAGIIRATNADEARMLISQAQTSGNPDSIIYAYNQALAFTEFDKSDIYLSIAGLERQRNNNGKAEQTYRQALSHNPKRQDVREALGLLLVDMKRHDEAEQIFNEIVAADRLRLGQNAAVNPAHCVTDAQSPWRSYNALGLLADIIEKGSEARHFYQCALTIAPGSAMVYSNLGFSYYLDGEYPQAERALTRAVNQQPDYQRAWSNLGLLYFRWGRQQEALQALRKVMTQAEALNDMGYIAMMEGEYTLASGLFQRAIDSSPSYYPRAVENLEQAKTMSEISKR